MLFTGSSPKIAFVLTFTIVVVEMIKATIKCRQSLLQCVCETETDRELIVMVLKMGKVPIVQRHVNKDKGRKYNWSWCPWKIKLKTDVWSVAYGKFTLIL